MPEIASNNCVQARPVYALLFIVAQASGAPDAETSTRFAATRRGIPLPKISVLPDGWTWRSRSSFSAVTRDNASKLMKTTQKQTVREGKLGRFPKFMMPPELLILREVELLETAEDLSPPARLHYIIRQLQRD